MKETIVVNLFGQPGAGKSTMMAEVFAMFKHAKLSAEMVTEFAKDLVWEERDKTFENELYIFGKQHHRLMRVVGEVDIIVTDRPLMLTNVYNNPSNNNYVSYLNDLAFSEHKKLNNINFFLNRVKKYVETGRNQTEEESDIIGESIKAMLKEYDLNYIEVDGSKQGAMDVYIKTILRLDDLWKRS